MRRALIVVGKAPEAGLTKTRLVPPLTLRQAAELYRAFLLDAVDLGLSADCERVSVVHPRGAAPALSALLPRDVHLLEQPTHGLGDALAFAFQTHLDEGFGRVVLIGSDNPTLPADRLQQAFAALDGHDLSIGPSADGGYYLIGLRRPHLGIFQAIEWSTPRVYAQTLARARRLNLRVQPVPDWYDVDTPADLAQLQLELASASGAVARHTRAAMARLGRITQRAEQARSASDPSGRRTHARPARQRRGPAHAWPG
jgi:rSAM/selenodomain-associated transferase 1